MPKKVLFITYYFPPSGGSGVQRPLKFIKYLRQFDWEPIVFTIKNGEYPALDETLWKEVPENTTVLRVPAFEPYKWYKKFTNKNKTTKIDRNVLETSSKSWKDRIAIWLRGNIFIPDARRFWIRPSIKFLSRYLKENKIDAVISTGPPHSAHLIALAVKEKFGIPWIADFRDPWTKIYYHQHLQLSKWAEKRHLELEEKVLKYADIVVTIGKTLAEELAEIRQLPVEYIYNGYDESDFAPYRNLPLHEKFTLTYMGTLLPHIEPTVLWSALAQWLDKNPEAKTQFQIRMIGKIPEKVKQNMQQAGLSEYTYYSPDVVEHHTAIEEICKSHILFMSVVLDKNTVSGKLFEYLASGKPFLCFCNPEGDAAQIIQQCNAGTVLPYDAEYSKIEAFLDKEWQRYKAKDFTAVPNEKTQQLSRKYQTGQLAQLLNRCVS